MKKILSILVALGGLCLVPAVSYAATGSGACSWHDGVDCSAGPDYDDSVICEDGWKDSTVAYGDVCEEAPKAIYIYNCDEYYGIMSDYEIRGWGLASFYSTYILVPQTCPLVMEGYLAQGLYSRPSCPVFSTRDAGTDKCKCDAHNFSAGWKCVSGYDVCKSEYGNLATWDTYTKSCSCLNLNEHIDTTLKQCVRTVAQSPQLPIQQSSSPVVTITNTVNPEPISSTDPNGDTWLVKQIASQLTTDNALVNRLLGRILLQAQEHGEAWYLDPVTKKRYYMKDGAIAYQMLRSFGMGITNSDLQKLQKGDKALIGKLRGRIVLQVQAHGEAFYIHPITGTAHYMKDGAEAYRLMRELSLGITNLDIPKIPIGEIVKK